MSYVQPMNIMISESSSVGKNSLTFESVVCTQLELQRRAASFSHRRSTMCRQGSPYRLSAPSNRMILLSPESSSSSILDITNQFLTTRQSNDSRTLSIHSMPVGRTNSIIDRQSSVSTFYWNRSSRSVTSKKNQSQWSLDLSKETPFYSTLRSRLIEEYTESESLLEFAKKTILVLLKTNEATVFLCLILILSIIMMTIGVSHLNDCPRQTNLPIYLFVDGIVWTTKLLQNIWYKYRLEQKNQTDEEPSSERNDDQTFIDGLMTLFLIIWFFFGQYWLITIGYPPYFEQPLENPETWCEKTVVYCAVISIIITYLILILFLSIASFLICYTRCIIIKRASIE